MFSILIPSFNNLNYLKLAIESINENSIYNNQIIVHVNVGSDGTISFLEENKIEYTFTNYNSGICTGLNMSSKKAAFDYLLYAHDDFYFCPEWDKILYNEVKKIGHNAFYLSGTMMHEGQIKNDCGDSYDTFNKKLFLESYDKTSFKDFQGSTWAPHLIHREYWDKVGGMSEEFNPGTGSDPDLNMKLWKQNVRIFKGISKFRVYHFGSIVTRGYRNNDQIVTETGRKGARLFLLKWKITIKLFKKYYLRSDTIYDGPLKEPKKTFKFIIMMFFVKIYYLYYFLVNKIHYKYKI